MNFEVKGGSLRVLKHLAEQRKPTSHQFPIGFFANQSELKEAQTWLLDNQYLEFDGNKFTLTDKANQYLKQYDDYGLKSVYSGSDISFDFVLIEILYKLDESVPIDCLPKGLLGEIPRSIVTQSSSPISQLKSHTFLSFWLNKYVVINNNDIILNEAGKRYVKHMKEEVEKPKEEVEAEDRPYLQYFDNSVHNHTHGDNSNINLGNIVTGDNNSLSNTNLIINEGDETKLIDYGVSLEDIAELKRILQVETKDKNSLWSKIFKWIGGVAASVASKGLSENLPAITHLVQNMLPPIS
jgi:hypothetical protein